VTNQGPDHGSTQQGGQPPDTTTTQQPDKNSIDYWKSQAENNLKRYQGASQVISARDQEVQELRQELQQLGESKSSVEASIESIKAQYEAKVSTLTESLTGTQVDLEKLTTEHNNSTAELTKFEVLRDYPDLLPLADQIPAVSEKEQMERIAQQYYDGIKEVVTRKVKEVSSLGNQAPAPANTSSAYSTSEAWNSALTQAAGTTKFEELSQQFRQWLTREGKGA